MTANFWRYLAPCSDFLTVVVLFGDWNTKNKVDHNNAQEPLIVKDMMELTTGLSHFYPLKCDHLHSVLYLEVLLIILTSEREQP